MCLYCYHDFPLLYTDGHKLSFIFKRCLETNSSNVTDGGDDLCVSHSVLLKQATSIEICKTNGPVLEL